MEWEAYRSRHVIWVKEHTNGRGEAEFRDKDSRTYPRETFIRQYEKVEPATPPNEQVDGSGGAL